MLWNKHMHCMLFIKHFETLQLDYNVQLPIHICAGVDENMQGGIRHMFLRGWAHKGVILLIHVCHMV